MPQLYIITTRRYYYFNSCGPEIINYDSIAITITTLKLTYTGSRKNGVNYDYRTYCVRY